MVDLKAANELEMVSRVRKAAEEAIAKVREACAELRHLPAEVSAVLERAVALRAHSFVVKRPDHCAAADRPFLYSVTGTARYEWRIATGSARSAGRQEPPEQYGDPANEVAPFELEEGRRYHLYTIVIAGAKD